ncbi:MAG: Asp23/Gls24 family envelope stress response protein [Thermoleophilia bacterium]|nr:Asp23/Gls24 family envelope stress response protein [Thermoleophilia bacterium]MDH4345371.1 Asp23/Gls24 family envelope stress response protein [Thermoleophilia bacterium]MDH5333616.1 Asp23/Gls24 family envelope stress response protein [Thermoleophilia bacterium]
MEREVHLARATELGRITVSSEAISQIVGQVASECYGVVGLAGRRGLPRLRPRDRLTAGIEVDGRGDGLEIELSVVIEYGLNLAEVASTVRSRVAYEVERQTGLPVTAVEVRIDDVRRSD